MHHGRGADLQLGIKMPTLHYGWSRSLLLAAWVWGYDKGQGQRWLGSWLLCKVCLSHNHIAQKLLHTYNLLIIHKVKLEKVKKYIAE